MTERHQALAHAAWVSESAVFSQGGNLQALAWLDSGYRDGDGPVIQGSLWDDVCDPEASTCPEADKYELMALVVPFEARPDIERFDLVVTLGLAAATLGATFLLVARRRPD
jgi:hypothetical protein